MPYLLYGKTASNHKHIIGLFRDESQAKIYIEVNKSKHTYHLNYVIEKINFLDGSPEIIEFVLNQEKVNYPQVKSVLGLEK